MSLCLICSHDILETPIIMCKDCHTKYHFDCFIYNDNRCAIYGCAKIITIEQNPPTIRELVPAIFFLSVGLTILLIEVALVAQLVHFLISFAMGLGFILGAANAVTTTVSLNLLYDYARIWRKTNGLLDEKYEKFFLDEVRKQSASLKGREGPR